MAIKVGDMVQVKFNSAATALIDKAIVLHVPCATGDSWGFKVLGRKQEIWTTEPITIYKREHE